MDSSIMSKTLHKDVDPPLSASDIAFLFETSQTMARIATANELFDFVTRTLRDTCNAAIAGIARTTEDKLIGQILSVDAANIILAKAIAVVGRGLRGAPIAVPMVFRQGPGLSTALWEEAIYQSTNEPIGELTYRRPNNNLGRIFGLSRVYGFPFRYDGRLYATAGVVLPEGQSLTPVQCITVELFLAQAMLAARTFLLVESLGKELRRPDPSEHHYRSMFDQTDVAVFVVDNNVVVDCNAQVSMIFGVAPHEIIGRSLYSLVPHDVATRMRDRIDRRLAAALNGEPQAFEMVAGLPDGSKRVVEMRMLPLDLPAGKRVLQVIARDCSERRQMEEALRSSEARYRELFETSADGIAIFDEQSRLIDCNRALLDMLGYDHVDELRGISSYEVTPPEYHDKDSVIHEQIDADGGYQEYEKEYVTRSGKRILVLVRIWARRNSEGKVIGGWSLLRDITASRQMENEVAHIEKFRLLGELAAAISHEIRNPLTTVRGFAQLLASRADCTPDDKEIYQLMLSEVDSATTIIRDFLDMARPTGPKRETCSLGELLQSLVRVMESQALIQSVQIKSEISPDLKVVGDPAQMRQVFVNLTQNAIQAMPQGGQMTITAQSLGKDVIVRVVDNGVGIAPVNLERIGRPFFTTRDGGTGLGLTTCYRIVRAHGGEIQVRSELGKGTEFTVRLPAMIADNH